MSKTNATEPALAPGTLEGFLIDGEQVTVIENPTGKHFMQVGRAMAGDADKYYPCAMHVLLRVGGKQLAPQIWEEKPWNVYTEAISHLVRLGFHAGA